MNWLYQTRAAAATARGVWSHEREDVRIPFMDPRPDTELLAAALAGDGEAFGAFYRLHARRIAAFHLARTHEAQDAADLTAETFAVALEALDRFDPERGEPIAWLFGIARHRLAALRRRGAVEDRARRRMGIDRTQLDDAALEQVESAAGAELVRVELREGLDALPSDQRDAVALRVLLDHEYAEVADAAGISEVVARKRVSRGLSALRARLASGKAES
jgi:RNA polymerase sigma factor (sigma-70 family)